MSQHESRVPHPPSPLEWHPAYRSKTWLLDWLNGDTAYPPDRLKIPMMQRLTTLEPVEPEASEPLRYFVLTRHRARAFAPYVGLPFHYEWWCAVDELGRGVAADSERVYEQMWRGGA